MKISALILMVTEDCNFKCRYCYQTRENHYMKWETAKQTLDFFLPRMKKNYWLSFLGGEPFLAYTLIKDVVSYVNAKNKELSKSVKYAVSTNGSLLDDNVLDFLNQNGFTLELSFDGYKQNWGRRKNSFKHTVSTIQKALKLGNISLETNSTFTSATASSICKSIELIMELGVQDILLSLDLTRRWNRQSTARLADEIANLRKLMQKNYRKNRTIPVALFREKKKTGIWQCPAGLNQLTVTPDGKVWGCPCFYEYFKGKESTREYQELYFGELEEFIRDHKKSYQKVLANYKQFRMDNFYTSHSRCFLCSLVEQCSVCPAARIRSTHPPLYVQPYVCEINRILIDERENLKKDIGMEE